MVAYGNAVIDMEDGSGRTSVQGVIIAAAPAGPAPFVSVLIGSEDPEKTTAGWIISANSTAQTMTFWSNATAESGIRCYQGSVLPPDSYVPGFAICPGVASGSLFPVFGTNFSIGPLPMNIYLQPSGSQMSFSAASEGCAPANLIAGGTPLGGGAFSAMIITGTAGAPPASLGVPPAACGFSSY
jgi:hypothetical protein